MATTDAPTPGSGRPRPWLLAALGVAILMAAWVWTRPLDPAGPAGAPSNARRQAEAPNGAVDPAALDVRLEALEARHPVEQATGRNPFRFQPKPPPPAPPPPEVRPVPPPPAVDPGPPPPPPIPLKFIGIVEPPTPQGDKVAVLSDCKITTYARPGSVVLGQYRLVSIGIESIVMEYLNGTGRTTIRQQGQECVSRGR